MRPHDALKAVFCFIILQSIWLPAAIAQNSRIDSLQKVLAQLPEDTSRVSTLNLLANQYYNSDFEKLKFYADQALALALKLDDPHSIGSSHLRVGTYFYLTKNLREALSHYQKAIEYYTIAGNRQGIASGYSNLGKLYKDMGNHPLAYEYYLKAFKEAESSGSHSTKASTALSMGNLLEILKKYDEGITFYNQALAYYRQTGNRDYEALVLHNMGNLYQSARQYDKAISFLNRSLHLADSLQLYRIQGYANNTLAYTYIIMQEYDKALAYLQKALQISEQHGNKQSTIAAMQGIADVYTQTNKVNEAIPYYKKALELAKPEGLAYEKLAAYKGMADAYRKQGEYKLALDYQSDWIALKDSVFNLENTQKMDQLQASFEMEKKQAEIELLQKDRERKALQQNAIGIGLVAMLLIAGLIVSRQRLKIRKNRLLLEKSEEVALKNEQLARQAEQLKELNETRSRFFANISHEFRTPLTLILNNLLDKIVQARQQVSNSSVHELSQLQVMYRNARRLLQLINQLLDLSKLESGRMKVQAADGDLHQLLHVVYDSFASLAEIKHIRFLKEFPADGLYCRFDADKTEKILYNLLSNAFKFTPDQGSVILKAELIHADAKSPLLQIRVQDSGPGISPEHIGQVFERFYQGDQCCSDEQGTGIGLALVKELVDIQGGRIWVESEKGKGASFILQLPYIPAEAPPFTVLEDKQLDAVRIQNQPEDYLLAGKPVQGSESIPVINEDKPQILLVDDNQDMRHYLRQHLQEKYQVIESENGLKGLEKAFETIPDLIVSDWMMPGLSGIALCERLKSDTRTSHIPVILLTALATDEGKLKGLETGADDYLTKPFDSRELNLRIRNLIESRRKLRERFSRELNLEPASITVTSTDEKFLQKVMKAVEDNISECEFSMEDFGSEVGLSRMQLHRKLKALTGKAPGDFLKYIRLKRAAQLLEMQAGNVSEIAYQVGFNNLSYFSKCFKEQFGKTPNEYISRSAMPMPQ